ncbi:hypothetical protein O3P69_016379 [Scylla paramamosain]|uniref:Uncharacterized protein n=1 Tax=Scylla paramamosain TaxID=85552 RepID=A0AAW0TDX9_SCYPA
MGYSYVAPSILFTDSVISDSSSLFKMSPDRRPSTTNLLLACSFKAHTHISVMELLEVESWLPRGSGNTRGSQVRLGFRSREEPRLQFTTCTGKASVFTET